MLDPSIARPASRIEEKRLERHRLTGIEKLSGGELAILDAENACRHLVLEIAGAPRDAGRRAGLVEPPANLRHTVGDADHRAQRRPAVEALNNFAANLHSYGSDAQAMALKQLIQIVHRQGVVMAFADVFFLLTLLFVALAGLAIVVKRPAAA